MNDADTTLSPPPQNDASAFTVSTIPASTEPPEPKKKTPWLIIAVLFIALTIPLTIFLVQQSQDIRQRAYPYPYPSPSPSAGCGIDNYPRCQDGTCGAGKECKKDEVNLSCKCLAIQESPSPSSSPVTSPSIPPSPTACAYPTNMTVVPATPQVALNTQAQIDITVTSVQNLGAYEFTLLYNPALVQVTTVVNGSFLGSTGRTATPVGPVIDNTLGKVTFGAFTFGTQPGPDGNGILATVTLNAIAVGTTDLTLLNTLLTDINAVNTNHCPINGSLTVTSEGGPSPSPAACTAVRIYRVTGSITDPSSWQLLTANDLPFLTPGETIYVTTLGTISGGGNVDKARIRVNSGVWTPGNETTSVKPGSVYEYYVAYTIPGDGTSVFTFESEVHETQTNKWY